jgi:hypothetical protein
LRPACSLLFLTLFISSIILFNTTTV